MNGLILFINIHENQNKNFFNKHSKNCLKFLHCITLSTTNLPPIVINCPYYQLKIITLPLNCLPYPYPNLELIPNQSQFLLFILNSIQICRLI